MQILPQLLCGVRPNYIFIACPVGTAEALTLEKRSQSPENTHP